MSCADVPGATVAVSTEYLVWLDWSVAGTLSVKIVATTDNAAFTMFTTTKTTNLSTASTQNLALMLSATTLADAVINHDMNSFFVDQN